jgi:CBS domain containing-hemolysin-like protein
MNTGNFWFSFPRDVIEEIVGDISDEFDDDNVNFTKIDEKTIFEGKINLKDFYRIIELTKKSLR